MKTLTIKFTGPLQSYGNEASFSRRTSADYPSKSAVIGFIAAALGYRRNDSRIVALNRLAFAVRVDQPGTMLTDFQTVEWKAGTRKVTYREYLQDALFMVAVGSEDAAVIDRIEQAIHHPGFQLFLGRRANVPAGPLQTHTYATQNPVEVLATLPWQAQPWYRRQRARQATVSARIIADANLLHARQPWLARDAVVSFDQRDRRFSYRSVNELTVELRNDRYHGVPTSPDTAHDAFGTVKGG